MKRNYNRRQFIKNASVSGLTLCLAGKSLLYEKENIEKGKKVGIIGLDTSHSVEFTKILNAQDAGPELRGYKVVAAYPKGSLTIKSSYSRIPHYIEEVKGMGVEIVDSISALLKKVDVVLLETYDGRRHLEQALPVLKSGKKMFIDKPLSGSLYNVFTIYDEAKRYNVPIFSSSSLRFMESVQAVVHGKLGEVIGAYTYGPAYIEETHPDLFWYGIHGVEVLFTVMGTGCESVVRIHTKDTDVVVGTWNDGRVGSFRGTRSGKYDSGGIVYGTQDNMPLGRPTENYYPLLVQITKFFDTGKAPVNPEETFEIYTFMEAADVSKLKGGTPVSMKSVMEKTKNEERNKIKNNEY